ncbi:zinc finger and BTB domain-containing protein 41 isoform X2 [Spodoptera frugiperda]|uniref:Zinc finger and BTB domain-containing protein 41 isoform X1 n=1 Tax=Spodoptera frugiperda TaxID=7108 RepID=A0A9R0E091_SPOFR|nr:zinc finger and BTB domain-containing protein 41 isoform X1 [Spodoptera frugiperda]XP_050556898.1 zinc finger and BTB domain-containing protein 41 isoform X2 [Spodoptera frugiperda]
MEQDVEALSFPVLRYRALCSACLSNDRDLFELNSEAQDIFRRLLFTGDRFNEPVPEMDHLVCWECLALLKRFHKFKWQVHTAQEHLRVMALSRTQESMDHTYMSQSLSCLEMTTKSEYDKIFFDFSTGEEGYIIQTQPQNVKNEQYDVSQVQETSILDIDEHILEVPEIVLENPVTGVMSHIVVGTDSLDLDSGPSDAVMSHLTIGNLTKTQIDSINIITQSDAKPKLEKTEPKLGYVTEYMTEADMLKCRDEAKKKVQYASSVYKCELCIIGFYTQQQVEDHFVSAHRAKPRQVACKVCYVYVDESKIASHTDAHYLKYRCKLCAHEEPAAKLMQMHVNTHMHKQANNMSTIKIGDLKSKGRKKKDKETKEQKDPPKPGDLRKLLSKTSIEGYQCLECDMFFKNSRARKNHVARFHREGLQCDHCKKRFVNRTTLATHLKLHEGPLPRSECPICHKMVRVIQLKYHIQRHQNKSRYECTDCNKTFSHLATYQAHLKYSRAHASEQVFKFPCPMCKKGYPTKEAMQDHFNYQHLGKTIHKCPICNKPIASRANVDKHMMRIHGQKKEKPRTHICQECGKAFTDKKALTQHEVIHSGERPLSCDICQQTFKQKASLYTHRKRVHKVIPNKRLVEYMDDDVQHCKVERFVV